jgi:uncharacterized NAD(P)/FAD-binding protein YdhS
MGETISPLREGSQQDGDGVEVAYREREYGQLEHLRVDRVINCTGPESNCSKVYDPLLTNLIPQKLLGRIRCSWAGCFSGRRLDFRSGRGF